MFFIDGYDKITALKGIMNFRKKLPEVLQGFFEHLCRTKILYLYDSDALSLDYNSVFFIEMSDKDKKYIFSGLNSDFPELIYPCKSPGISIIITDNGIKLSFYEYQNLNFKCFDYSFRKTVFECVYKSDYDLNILRKNPYRFYPMRLKDFCIQCYSLFAEFCDWYLFYLQNKNLLMKDLYRDFKKNPYSLNVPINLQDVEGAANKIMLFQKKRLPYYSSFNKMTLAYAYSFCKALPFIKDSEVTVLLQNNFDSSFRFFSLNEKIRIKTFIYDYYKNKLRINSDNINYCEQCRIISDYINLVMIERKNSKFQLNLSVVGLYRKHDEFVEIINERQMESDKKKIVFTDKNPFYSITFPENFTSLITAYDFREEGKRQRNCVYSRMDDVLDNMAAIYGVDYHGKHYTLDLRMTEKNQIYIYECKGFANKEPSDDVYDYLNNVINNIAA